MRNCFVISCGAVFYGAFAGLGFIRIIITIYIMARSDPRHSRELKVPIWRAAYATSGGTEYELFVAMDERTANAYVWIRDYATGLRVAENPKMYGILNLSPEILRDGSAKDILSGECVGEFEEGLVKVVPVRHQVGEVLFTKAPARKTRR